MADNCYLCQLCPVVTTSGKVAKMVGSEKLCYGVESGGAFVTRAVPVFTVPARQVWDMCNWRGYNGDREGNLLYTDKIETLAQGKFAVVGIFSYYGGVFSTPEIFYSGTKQDVASYCSTLFVGGAETVMRHGIVYQIEVWRLVAEDSHMLPDLLRVESRYSQCFRDYTKQTAVSDAGLSKLREDLATIDAFAKNDCEAISAVARCIDVDYETATTLYRYTTRLFHFTSRALESNVAVVVTNRARAYTTVNWQDSQPETLCDVPDYSWMPCSEAACYLRGRIAEREHTLHALDSLRILRDASTCC